MCGFYIFTILVIYFRFVFEVFILFYFFIFNVVYRLLSNSFICVCCPPTPMKQIDTLLACGGLAKNPVFIQEHADITGLSLPVSG